MLVDLSVQRRVLYGRNDYADDCNFAFELYGPLLSVLRCHVDSGLAGTAPTPGGGTFSGDYVAANWNWDFNDPSSSHKGTIGFGVAHVFDNPGSYNVTCRVRDLGGNAGFGTTTITVSAMSGNVYYVSTAGSDGANGLTPATAFATIAHALSVGGSTNNTILLRNGDTFALSSETNFSETGPFRQGAYVDPVAPSATKPHVNITLSGTPFQPAFNVQSGSDIRFTDIAFNYSNAGQNGCAMFFLTGSTNILAERIDATFNSPGGYVFNTDTTSDKFVVADSNLHDFSGYAAFAASPQFAAYFGNTISNYTTNNHAIRVNGGTNGVGAYATNTYLAENVVTPNASIAGGFGDITERGDNTKSVIVGNTIIAPNGTCATIQPQNTGSVEHVINSLYEGNNCVAPLTPFAVIAQHVYIRNNVFNGADVAILDLGDPQMPPGWTTDIFAYNNTHYTATVTGSDIYFVKQNGTTGNITIGDNIMMTASTSTTSTMYVSFDLAGSFLTSHNHLYAPNAGTLVGPNVGTGGISSNTANPKFVSNGSDFHLQSTSPDRNAGTAEPVYQDLTGVPRPQESVQDIGAYEYKP